MQSSDVKVGAGGVGVQEGPGRALSLGAWLPQDLESGVEAQDRPLSGIPGPPAQSLPGPDPAGTLVEHSSMSPPLGIEPVFFARSVD